MTAARTFHRRGLLVALMLAGLLGVAACLPVPLGDPAKSKADSRYFGVWEWRDARVYRAIIRPWDERTFAIDVLTGEIGDDPATTKPKARDVYKGWLTEVKGQTFLTMQPIETLGMVNGDPRQSYYIVTKVKLDGATMTATPVSNEYEKIRDVKSAAALEKVIADNIDDPKLFQPNSTVLTKWSVEQMKGLEKLQETFQGWK